MKPLNIIYQQSIELLNAEEGATHHLCYVVTFSHLGWEFKFYPLVYQNNQY